MHIRRETIAGMSLFKDELLDSFILHIPHASTHIPDLKGFYLNKIEENITLLTDWATEQIFDIDGIEKIVTPFSRLFCDVERFEDEAEPMFHFGRGFFYTNGYDGSALRKLDTALKASVYTDFYLRHHQKFYEAAKSRLENHSICHIVDCHSFNDNPLVPGITNPKSPDICIGTDQFHTPAYLLNYTVNYFTKLGYSVEVNNPYAGCIIPKPYFMKNAAVKGIMIEVNKRLYMHDHSVNDLSVQQLQKVMNGYFEDL